MGNVHMEATQINYRGGIKKMDVEEAIKAAGDEIDSLRSGLINYQTQNDLNLEVPNRKNLCNTSDMVSGYPVSNEAAIGNTVVITSSQYTNTYKNAVYVKAGQTYTISWTPNTPSATSLRYSVITDSNGVVLEVGIATWVDYQNYYTFTPAHSGYLYVSSDINATNYQIEVGSTATAYTPYIPSVESRLEALEAAIAQLTNS